MAKVEFAPEAQAEMRAVLRFTLTRYGAIKAREYRHLIADARRVLQRDPFFSPVSSELGDDARVYRIRQPGKAARHVFLYRVRDGGELVQVVGFIYDGMDLPQQWWVRTAR